MKITERLNAMATRRASLAQRLHFLDSNIWLGRPEGFPLAREIAPADLSDHLAQAHLAGGLVSHWRGKTISAQDGNAALVESDRVLPDGCYTIWTGLPLYPVERGLLPGVSAPHKRMRAVRLFPRSHNFPLGSWSTGSLCVWLGEHGLPLFVWHTEIDWSSLRQLALQFAQLTIVVETQPRKILYHTRSLFMLMRECANVLLEISNFAGPGFVEAAVGEFGAQRLLYGSFLPVSDPFVPMGLVLDADLPDADKALIAGGNLQRLLVGVRL